MCVAFFMNANSQFGVCVTNKYAVLLRSLLMFIRFVYFFFGFRFAFAALYQTIRQMDEDIMH